MSLVIALTIILPCASVAAAEGTLTLQDAIQSALKENPSIQATRERVEEARASKGLAYSGIMPQVSATGLASYRKDASSRPSALFGGDPYNNYSFELRASQLLFSYGLLDGLRVPERDIELRQIEIELADRDLSANVIRSYYDVLLAQRRLELLLNTQAVQQEAQATTERRFKIGRSQRVDVLQIKTQLALVSSRIAQARNRIQIAAVRLANLLGKPDLREIRLQGGLDAPPFESVQRTVEVEKPKYPELEQVQVTRERLSEEKDVVFGQNLPQLSAVGLWGRSAFVRSDLLDSAASSWSLSLQLTVPIFSGLSSFRERAAYASRAQQLDFREAATANQIALGQSQSQQDVKLAEATVRSTREALELSKASLEEGRRNYSLATIDSLQYLSIQEANLNAELEHETARHDYVVSLLNYFTASGLPLARLTEILGEKI